MCIRLIPIVLTMTLAAATTVPELPELNRMIARFSPAELHVDTASLSPGDRQALAKLVEAAGVIDRLFLTHRRRTRAPPRPRKAGCARR